jgi:hypothetical protein
MERYAYNGPVLMFGKWVANWKGETMADSEKKAKSNLAYQYKTKNKLVPSTKVTLPGDLTRVS